LQQLTSQWPAYLGYFTTFMTVGMGWIGHHQMLHDFERIDETMLILNLLALLFITLTPFTTELLGQYIQHPKPGADQIAVLVYGGNWLLNDLVFVLMWWYARRNHFLKPGLSEAHIRGATRGFVGSSIITVFGMFVGLLSAQLSLLIYLSIALFHASPVLRIFAKPHPEVKPPSQ
ncbi:MAG TPA: TMEM175 family protein, partial [Aggregatilineaceae bacterium]|nr:TMEM175 family protein [Aggregatilineaceae bacterium]